MLSIAIATAVAGVLAPLGAARLRSARSAAARRAQAEAQARWAQGGGAVAPTPPPTAPQAPPAIPAPPQPSGAGAAVANGGRALAAILGATPFAPLSFVVGPLAGLFGAWIDENEKAHYAQQHLLTARSLALRHAQYEGYMTKWAEGTARWNEGLNTQAQALFAEAEAAGQARRMEVAQRLDVYEVDRYREWMQQRPAFGQGPYELLLRGWLLGDAGITGWAVEGGEGAWQYQSEVDGVSRQYHWQQGHPDYDGRPLPSVSASAARATRDAALERQRRAVLEAATGGAPGSAVSDGKLGTGRDAALEERLGGALPDEVPEPPPAPAPAPPAPAPLPPAKELLGILPLPPRPPAPVAVAPVETVVRAAPVQSAPAPTPPASPPVTTAPAPPSVPPPPPPEAPLPPPVYPTRKWGDFEEAEVLEET